MKVLFIDNYDSFSYNSIHILRELKQPGDIIDLIRNDQIDFSKVADYDKIIISPGPGIPTEYPDLLRVIREFSPTHPILGICLGHQAIGVAFGAKMVNTEIVYHGIQSVIQVVQDAPLFKGLPSQLEVGRYHSWSLASKDLPDCLAVTSVDPKDQIMSISHKVYDVHGVQFHPESFMTPHGKNIIKNFLYN